ncbi:MAG TPA: family 43 glycosylhydrolase [Acidimicrobiales bacterium]|nr:family 43 glycosylhydrolase [Acidimicrobiales bacterium]
MRREDGGHREGARLRHRGASGAVRRGLGPGLALAGTLNLVLLTSGTLAATAPETRAALRPHGSFSFTVSLPGSSAFPGHDAGDPDVIESAGTYYAFTTGTPLGNHIQVLVDTSGSPSAGWRSYTGQNYGSTALPNPASWEQTNTQTSPGVFFFNNQWIMFYDAAQSGHASDTGYDCLAVATAPSISPTGAAFTDSGGPLWCPGDGLGTIDPAPYIDPATGSPWLVWKSNDGGSSAPARIMAEELNPADATTFLPGSSPTQLFYNDTVAHPWETTVEDPSILAVNGYYFLLFAAGTYTSPSYSEGYAVCSSPVGPCTQNDPNPIVSSYGNVAGPGGGSWFQDQGGRYWLDFAAWTGCAGNPCGGTRDLYVAPVTLSAASSGSGGINKPAVGLALTPDSGGYWIAAQDGGIFSFGDAAFHGSAGAIALNKPIVGMAATPGGGGYWLVASDGGIFSYGDANFWGSAGAITLNKPIVGMAATRDGGGYWLVASDGGIFSYGDAAFHGSAGAIHLNKPIVGMAATTSGGGYWLVASDGGIFSYGDAAFWGSAGAITLNKPIVGMAATTTGGGYWLVASDGGIFSYGDAAFHGSAGAIVLNKPIVGMAATTTGGGYTLVASDGGIFTYGDASFFGSPA